MSRYAVINPSGVIENIIAWNGESQILLPADYSVEEASETHLDQWKNNAVKAAIQPISRGQGKLALHRAGLLTQAEAIIAQADIETRIWYEEQTWERLNPVVIQMGAALGLTPEQIDSLFLSASQ